MQKTKSPLQFPAEDDYKPWYHLWFAVTSQRRPYRVLHTLVLLRAHPLRPTVIFSAQLSEGIHNKEI